ncbi:copper resistance protein CopC [Telmatospirillum sp.]|uniref:copper resistance CopC family protein n=1 Tax=Telmatospirillum sp. TaxID=2079197 RepID=UPI002846E2F6|nr:copper resistance protein CopC [Telmatospirillum sp.]MDR3441182.1 copper resistance protein CopC [Telmatospirillum sp.]
MRQASIAPIVSVCRMAPALAAGILLCGYPGGPATARNNLSLRASDPAAEAVLVVSPREVTLTFDQPVEPAFSAVAVLDGTGRRLDGGHMERDPVRVGVVHVTLERPASGVCQVKWKMVGAAGRTASGRFIFTVAR